MDAAVPEHLESFHGEEYLSLALAERELHQYALQHGFALTKKKFVKDKHKDNLGTPQSAGRTSDAPKAGERGARGLRDRLAHE